MEVTRRDFLKSTAIAGAPFAAAPLGFVPKKRTLRILGTHVTLQEKLRIQAEKDLGFHIEFQPGGSAAVLHLAATQPESFDLYEQWSNSINVLWQAKAIQQIDTRRLTHWDEISDLSRKGVLTPGDTPGAGDAPNRILFVQPDDSVGEQPSDYVSFMPYVHNVDSFGYDANVVERGKPYDTESWGWLLDPQWAGRVALVNDPTIGLFDAALAAQSLGLVTFEDIGDIRRDELDALFKVLIDLRRAGHFRGVWSSVPRSVELMRSGEVAIESIFSPGVFALRGNGVECVNASPKEGYRAWHGVMCLSSRSDAAQQSMAYEYMNWWLSGWPGAFIARQGYYISNPQTSKDHLSVDEWDYWYLGKPAGSDLPGTDSNVVVKKGEVRDGGSYTRRFKNIAVWNTVMNTFEYSLPAWNEFLSAT